MFCFGESGTVMVLYLVFCLSGLSWVAMYMLYLLAKPKNILGPQNYFNAMYQIYMYSSEGWIHNVFCI